MRIRSHAVPQHRNWSQSCESSRSLYGRVTPLSNPHLLDAGLEVPHLCRDRQPNGFPSLEDVLHGRLVAHAAFLGRLDPEASVALRRHRHRDLVKALFVHDLRHLHRVPSLDQRATPLQVRHAAGIQQHPAGHAARQIRQKPAAMQRRKALQVRSTPEGVLGALIREQLLEAQRLELPLQHLRGAPQLCRRQVLREVPKQLRRGTLLAQRPAKCPDEEGHATHHCKGPAGINARLLFDAFVNLQ
mmetsp:Transcript_38860/g.92917  ORF Transcript_38860/g.92917 Transcript_38860/m.92917 type:complete len:244 (-) Transcript_38860:202-933(-)